MDLSRASELMELVAEHFRALAEPARLRLLNAMGAGERTVTELVERTGLGQANVSQHLRQLHAMRFVARRKDGLHVRYRVADPEVMKLCALACVPRRRPLRLGPVRRSRKALSRPV